MLRQNEAQQHITAMLASIKAAKDELDSVQALRGKGMSISGSGYQNFFYRTISCQDDAQQHAAAVLAAITSVNDELVVLQSLCRC